MWRILHRLGLGRLPASQRYKRTQTRWKRYEKQCSCHQLQVDVKLIEPLGQTGKKGTPTDGRTRAGRCSDIPVTASRGRA